MWRLFLRFRFQHREIRLAPSKISDSDGKIVGYFDSIRISKGFLNMQGWALADRVSIETGDHCITEAQLNLRPDVTEQFPNSPAKGFSLNVPFAPEMVLRLGTASGPLSTPIPSASAFNRVRADSKLAGKFFWSVLKNLNPCFSWLIHPTDQKKHKLKQLFKMGRRDAPDTIRVEMLSSPIGNPEPQSLLVVLPVYNGSEFLEETLQRLENNTVGNWNAIIVDDGSPDPRIKPMLKAFRSAHPQKVTVLFCAENQGFVASVNQALAHAGTQVSPVVLLNSDAWVPPGWDLRLLEPFRKRNIASVTPLSNNAELCTVPRPCQSIELKPGEADRLDKLAQRFSDQSFAEAPTGVGFCMALAPRFLSKFPNFDLAFGDGYGEEVDWCQKARGAGGVNVIQHRLFVEHIGAQSFGTARRTACVMRANELISKRYPAFDREVQEFLENDPLATVRMALAVGRLSSASVIPMKIFVGHSLGGGAEKALMREVDAEISKRGAAFILRVGGRLRWTLELKKLDGTIGLASENLSDIQRILEPLKQREVVYSCGVGDVNPIELPDAILKIAEGGRIVMRIHDYFSLSPSIFLVDGQGRQIGVPDDHDTHPDHQFLGQNGAQVSIQEWRKAWRKLFKASHCIRVFSHDSTRRVTQAYPEIKNLIEHRPHRIMDHKLAACVRPTTNPKVIASLGNLNVPKGGITLCQLADMSKKMNGPKFIAIGQIDPQIDTAALSKIHGPYAVEQVGSLISRYNIGAWIIPSVCPETFSFTTHEALATMLPVFGFNLGAQAEALRSHDNGQVLSIPRSDQALRACIGEFQAALEGHGLKV